MKKESIKYLTTELKKSGIPLEVKILKKASEKVTGRLPNLRYVYNKEIHEIDLIVRFSNDIYKGKGNWLPHSILSEMVIECKKREKNPWIFFCVDKYFGSKNTDFLGQIKYDSDLDPHISLENGGFLLNYLNPLITYHHYSNSSIPKCINYSEAFKDKDKNKSEIYDACISVTNYIRFQNEIFNKIKKRNKRKMDDFPPFLRSYFYYPLIVLDGELLVAKFFGDDIILEEFPHIQLRTFLHDNLYIIDIIKENEFSNYLNTIEKDHQHFVKEICKIKLDEKFSNKCRKRFSDFEKWSLPSSYIFEKYQLKRKPSKNGKRLLV